jgi:hypothetical protein
MWDGSLKGSNGNEIYDELYVVDGARTVFVDKHV